MCTATRQIKYTLYIIVEKKTEKEKEKDPNAQQHSVS
jgi:hypothetical protein